MKIRYALSDLHFVLNYAILIFKENYAGGMEMGKWLTRIYEENELAFALAWIGIYCLANSLATPISGAVGIDSSATLLVNGILSVAVFMWIRNQGLLRHYGLCKGYVPASKFLWYLPLALFASTNLWRGIDNHLPVPDAICYILSMLCVGFLEEVIFRGFLFRALAKDNVKTAIVISSVTFGVGHILNLFNGSGMELVENLCQVFGAIACGFLFVIIFQRGGSLLPCIVAHGVNNAVSVFANTAEITAKNQLFLSAAILVIVVGYVLVLIKTLPSKSI